MRKPFAARPLRGLLGLLATATAAPTFASCMGYIRNPTSSGSNTDPPQVTMPIPFEAVASEAYVTKIKDLLTGLPPTQAEIDAVTRDESALRGLIDGWLRLPQAQSKLLPFFTNAFQQAQVGPKDFGDQLGGYNSRFTGIRANLLAQRFQESFARTVWELAMVQNRPFTEVITTRSYMMSPALLVTMLYMSRMEPSGTRGLNDPFLQAHPDLRFVVQHAAGPVPLAESVNPSSPNFMHWYSDRPIDTARCPDPVVVPPDVYPGFASMVYKFLNSDVSNVHAASGTGQPDCLMGSGLIPTPLTDADYNTWRMVRFRQPNPGEPRVEFWDVPALRTVTELAVPQQRVGFFTHPAFFANWRTNVNNQYRVTINQALIVALGQSFDSSDTLVMSGPPSATFDAEHASNPACAGCHVVLDPMRQFFGQAYNTSYQMQGDSRQRAVFGTFTLDGAQRPGQSLYDLADMLASHPNFARAWVQKVCYWANSAECVADDPEFVRIVTAFQNNHFDFRTMLIDLLSSPIVTGARPSTTRSTQGEIVAIARANHFCVALSNRLGLADACNVTTATGQVAANIPSDGYMRGAIEPFLTSDPGLFVRASTEHVCWDISAQVVDAGMRPRYRSTDVAAATADMVRTVMAIQDGSARFAPAVQILTEHYAAAVAAGETPVDAMRSTFTLACTSPTASSVGL